MTAATETSSSVRIVRDSGRHEQRRRAARRPLVGSAVLLLGAVYCLVPVLWVLVASTKSNSELFTTLTFLPGTGLLQNISDLFSYGGGLFGLWAWNSLIFAGFGAVLSTLISTMAGYALAKFQFPGRQVWFYAILAGVLLPGITLAIPQYLLMSKIGLAGSYWSVLLPCLISPFGIFLARVYASSAIPSETMEAARIDGAGDVRIFTSVALPMMVPGMVTIFLLQFVGIWNNFLLPFIMLSDESKYPLTVGLYTLLSKGSGTPSLYSLAIIGAAVSIIPLIIMMLVLQRYWRLDLVSGGLKG
ncbi:carbohydrate ABC transporter permease [Microbacterium sp. MPKO10]|uniref:carbohydrate ABC transporter permease n=1 Tax=Microbacterium sp. MPKO10 TaxID=2989818 RepID=UPI002236B5AE|nr:carbohydrate ABC transporter permease [Microbacterium sp. MPKO10]MCW4456997.1 carbohydrate ABC transporter permease [Microbacterium sp. MPKO10]